MNVMSNEASQGVGGAADRGKECGRRAPSRILGIAWVLMLLGALTTYVIWGFHDANSGYEDLYDEYDTNDDEGNDNQNNDDGNQVQVANDDGG